MSSVLFRRSSQIVMITAVFFMFLNAFLPLDFLLEATEYPFKLRITLEKTVFRLGEPVNVTLILTNIGNENVTLYYTPDHRDLLIRDTNFNYVSDSGKGHIQIVMPYPPIAPGDSRTTWETWEQTYDDIYDEEKRRFKQVPPGTYYVAGTFRSNTYGVRIETPVIRITILGV